ncbi:hypothetical protein EVAR_34238_1 [Eumeta japonica]|uniref:HTH OST-type domain-containing protein n=1 Tax=Eumeta variegata TaxID=151549 RepID=A0A4C1WZB1_EUMVA|nr:hypothetical protein EVAR_34238_1 [Eumeta japonica]
MDELDEFCKELRALVVSSPVPMDLRSLARDYRSYVGKPMPLQRLGYKNLLSFLKERCSDSFVTAPARRLSAITTSRIYASMNVSELSLPPPAPRGIAAHAFRYCFSYLAIVTLL